MPLYHNRLGRFDSPPSQPSDFCDTIPAGSRIELPYNSGNGIEMHHFITNKPHNAETLCDEIEARYPQCGDSGLDAINLTPHGAYIVHIGR